MPLSVTVQMAGSGAGSVDPADLAAMKKAALAALRAMQASDAELSLTILDDTAIAELNEQWLRHAGPTDVISFPLFEAGESPVGDIYVGVEQARRQAEALGLPLREELVRLAIHGTLHVLGMDHPAGASRSTSPMWLLQERILNELINE